MQRFFVTFPLGIDVILTDVEIYHQLTRVLRVQKGEHICLFDGDGFETEYEILQIDKKSITLSGKNRVSLDTEPKKSITLYQALPNKYEKIEYIIQKWVEVGVKRFVFFRSDRSQKLVLSENKRSRFVQIAREALEQCGGAMMPDIEFHDTNILLSSGYRSSKWESPNSSHDIVLDTTGKLARFSEFSLYQDIGVWVGPEGGWSHDERDKMNDNGFIFARFWNRVLRTETAWIVCAFGFIHG